MIAFVSITYLLSFVDALDLLCLEKELEIIMISLGIVSMIY
jgi:hypothetical protein